MSPDRCDDGGLEIVRVKQIVRCPVRGRVIAVHQQRILVDVGDNRVGDGHALVQVGTQLRDVEGIKDLCRHGSAAGFQDIGLAEVTRPLERCWDRHQRRSAPVMPQIVIASEEEQLVFLDGAAHRAAYLVHLECRPRDAVGIIVSAISVQGLIAQAVVRLAVELVGARAGAHGDHGLPMSVLRAEVVGNHTDFLQTFRVRHHRGLVIAPAHDRKAVQLDVVGKGAAAVDAQSGKLAPAIDANPKGVNR